MIFQPQFPLVAKGDSLRNAASSRRRDSLASSPTNGAMKAYLLKESLDRLWTYRSERAALRYLLLKAQRLDALKTESDAWRATTRYQDSAQRRNKVCQNKRDGIQLLHAPTHERNHKRRHPRLCGTEKQDRRSDCRVTSHDRAQF